MPHSTSHLDQRTEMGDGDEAHGSPNSPLHTFKQRKEKAGSEGGWGLERTEVVGDPHIVALPANETRIAAVPAKAS